ncbi:DUF1254 domain-containing protein [Streptomyces sp. NBC_01550]|uniref:DUF1254 domain-containing protein n=1 Tax=unclassified Streptomyces TaxID=2593676 RepID=UPI00367DE2EE|nr:DUF1254 domain-containing protein [Streptomyces sp. NBC_01620]
MAVASDPSEELVALAAEAYVYGYPLVFDLSTAEDFMQVGVGPLAPTPFNHFAHPDRSADPGTPCASGVDDTLCSVAQLDLSGGPIRLHVPDTGGAYYVLQFVDTWTNNFAYVGRRATGTDEGDWLVVPPGWAGSEPAGVRGVIDAPTSVVSVVGRIACDGPDDVERVRALQKQLTLTHLEPGTHRTGLPAPDNDVPEQLRFFEQLRVWMADFPPAAGDCAYQDRFQPLGLLEEGPSPYVSADPVLVRALVEGMERGRARVAEAGRPGAVDGGRWVMDPHLFDYNLDRFGVGTIDSPEWKMADREASYLVRAVAARVAPWGTHGYEAVFAHTSHDADGRRLNGAHSYVLRFEQPPPVGAFWSLTMYDAPDGRLVENPARRYAIGDRTPGLVRADDGSLTVHLGKDRPADPAAAANWLPAPDGDFRPVLRLYTPGRAVLDGSYRIPAVERG